MVLTTTLLRDNKFRFQTIDNNYTINLKNTEINLDQSTTI